MLKKYKELPQWNQQSFPKVFQEKHNTKEGTWGQVTVLSGSLKFSELSEDGAVLAEHIFKAGDVSPFVEPQTWHKVTSLSDDLECQLCFFCEPERYYEKKYALSATHSEVKALLPHLGEANDAKILDLGCGRGRNSLFLQQQGFQLTSLDKNVESLAALKQILEKEGLNSTVAEYDINSAAIEEDFQHIISTVVFQFLNPEKVPAVIANIQQHTLSGGCNLIVAPMDTADMPCPLKHLTFLFKEGELRDYYQAWDLLKYEELPGEFHIRDEEGNRLKAKFVAMVARKP